MSDERPPEYFKGKGAQTNPKNKFDRLSLSTEDFDGLDEPLMPSRPKTQVFIEHQKKKI